jgi:hypothetical protein
MQNNSVDFCWRPTPARPGGSIPCYARPLGLRKTNAGLLPTQLHGDFYGYSQHFILNHLVAGLLASIIVLWIERRRPGLY